MPKDTCVLVWCTGGARCSEGCENHIKGEIQSPGKTDYLLATSHLVDNPIPSGTNSTEKDKNVKLHNQNKPVS